METGALEGGRKLGVEVIAKSPATENDIAIQIQLLNALAAQGVQAIAVAPSSRQALLEPVAALAAKGIKIVVVDSPLGTGESQTFVGTDHRAAGQAAGKLLSTLIGEKDEISILRHSQTGAATGEREQGAIEKLRSSYPNAVIHADIYASTETGVENERCAFLLNKYPNTKGLITSGTSGSMAMLKLLKERSPTGGIKFVGFGFNLTSEIANAIEAGIMHGWVAQLPAKVGYQSIEVAVALIGGQTPPAITHVPVMIVTKENLHDPEVQALLTL